MTIASAQALERLRAGMRTAIQGKDEVIDLALTAVFAGGHLLIQDVPGVGKTTLAHALARLLGGSFTRIQFTADLLPGDITGVNVFDARSGEFAFRRGPVFANVVLADELNRTTPRCQSALFEAMSEGRVTVDGQTRALPRPFLVVATQNPYDGAGTYPLPDSQLDRFLMRVSMGYPDRESERQILRAPSRRVPLEPVLGPEEVEALAEQSAAVRVSDALEDYVLDVVAATRRDGRLVRGVSTRGAQLLHRAARARAFVRGRDFAVPEDVRCLAVPVLGHRVLPRRAMGPAGEGGSAVIARLIEELPCPG